MDHLGLLPTGKMWGRFTRSLDFEVIFGWCRLSCSSGKFCHYPAIMAGHELLGEGFAKGQTGSSAMPHKMNSRSERINGFIPSSMDIS